MYNIIEEVQKIFNSFLNNKKDIVILAGSFSRSEETYLKKNNILIPLSDIEFIIFQNNIDFLTKKNHLDIKNYLLKLSQKHCLPIDFSIKPILSLNFIPKTFFWYETLFTAKLIFGEKKLPVLHLKDVNSGDIYEVLNHSLISIIKNINLDDKMFIYKIYKAGLDLLIPLLYKYNMLVATHKKRYEMFLELEKNKFIKDEKIIKFLKEAYYIKCVNEIDEKLLKKNKIEVLKEYLYFSEYIFNLINKDKCKMGDNSVIRQAYKIKMYLKYKDINILKRSSLCNVYQENLKVLKKIINNDFKIYQNDIEKIMQSNKLFYRYL